MSGKNTISLREGYILANIHLILGRNVLDDSWIHFPPTCIKIWQYNILKIFSKIFANIDIHF